MSFFEKNMDLLGKRDPSLASAVSTTPVPETFCVLKSSSGNPTLFWNSPPSKSRFLHSPIDPALEARALLTNRVFRKQDGTLLIGLGLGYLAREISRKKEARHLLCIAEAIPGLFRLALEQSDLCDVIADEDTHFFIGDGITKILDGFRPLRLKAISGSFNKIAMPCFMEIYDGFYNEIEERIHAHLSALRQSYNTFLATRETSISNLFGNIRAIADSQAVDSLCGLIKGRPALVIAAGPSLSSDMGALKKVRPKCFTICVDTALKPVLENGILPDLAVTCDSLPINHKKIAGIPHETLASIPLLFCGDAFSGVVDSFGTTRFVTNSDTSLSQWLLNRGRSVARLPFFGTVAHLGFAVARFMGADPIILVGLDLSFPGENAHADGCTATWEMDVKAAKFISLPSNNGGQTRTTPPFLSMIRQFEKDIEKTRARCINVSRDGALIRGAEWMPLEQAADLGGGVSFDFKTLVAEAYAKSFKNPKSDLRTSLQWILSGVNEMENLSRGNTIEAFRSCLRNKRLLKVLFDYFPRYLISFHTIPEGDFPEPEADRRSTYDAQATLFLQESREILPVVKTACRRAIHALKSSD